MKKVVSFYVDLYPGWQDGPMEPWLMSADGNIVTLSEGHVRYRVDIALPCIPNETERVPGEDVTVTKEQG